MVRAAVPACLPACWVRPHSGTCLRAVACTAAHVAAPPTPAAAAEYLRGWRVKTSPVPLKPPFFAAIKSNNYLPNALALMDAQAEGFDQVQLAACVLYGGTAAAGHIGMCCRAGGPTALQPRPPARPPIRPPSLCCRASLWMGRGL